MSKSTKVTDSMDTTIESLFVEIENKHSKNIIIGCIYNPPKNNIFMFNDYLSALLEKIGQKHCYICGDFNINLLNHESHDNTNKFIDSLLSNTLYPLTTHPTRITDKSATLIDNIFTNVLNKSISSGLFVTDISDHLPNFQVTYNMSVEKEIYQEN